MEADRRSSQRSSDRRVGMEWGGDGYGYDLTEEDQEACMLYSQDQPVRAYGVAEAKARRDLRQGKAAELGALRILEGLGWSSVYGVDFNIYPRRYVGHDPDVVMEDPVGTPWKLSIKSTSRMIWSWVYQWDGARGDIKLQRDDPDGWLEVFTVLHPTSLSSRLVGLIDLQHLQRRKLFYRLQGVEPCLRNKRAVYYESGRIRGSDVEFNVEGLLTVPSCEWKILNPTTARGLTDA